MPLKQPTILQIIPRLDTGGAELATIEITQAVIQAGGRMVVLSEGGRLADRITQAGGELITFPAATKNPLRIIANSRALAQIIRDNDVSLLHARSRAPAWSALLAAKRTITPYIATYHGAYSETSWLKNRYNSVMARGHVVIANSHYTADLIKSRYDTPGHRVKVVYRGVDVDRFDPANIGDDRVAALRTAWRVTAQQRLILQAARLTSWKGHAYTIAALELLAKDPAFDDVVLIIAGDAQGRDSYQADLKGQIAQAGLTARVKITGHCTDMPAAFKTSIVAVVGSDGKTPEAFGRAGAEAQATGCPVIAANFGAPPETVCAQRTDTDNNTKDQDYTGWLVPPADRAALAAALSTALAMSPKDRQVLGNRARAHILANFTDTAMKAGTLRIYDEILHSKLAASIAQD